ncbi:MAG TPA: right-handed parallel beta-helix repeat-containing protein [Rhodanobacteraceae bacterium]|jgi:hypothetical protein|nr:right-handed parallel beta-helix repeat-containing protein [Rhodanobacteraceae bacterium]
MSNRNRLLSRAAKHAPLATCLTTALGLSLSAAQAADVPRIRMPSAQSNRDSVFELPSYIRENAAKRPAAPMYAPAQPAGPPHYVTTCGDDAAMPMPGTLRYEVANAADGATIDLSTLVCSTITLDSVIAINQDSLYLKGPAAGPSHLTIDAANHSEVFNHFGSSTLLISRLTITHGYYASSAFPRGGCIYSQGNVGLISSVVALCTIWSPSVSVPAQGGGVYTNGNLTLVNSTISGSEAFAQNGADANGGGAYVNGDFKAIYSTISDNTAAALNGANGFAGGVYVHGSVDIEGSTISGNQADRVGALEFSGYAPHTAKVINSTISNNIGTEYFGGIWTVTPMTLASSTVAFNRSLSSQRGNGVYSFGSVLTLNSSIIADNSGPDGPSDLDGGNGAAVSGEFNLITSSTLPPLANTITDCPRLEPLTNNGGTTRTHALLHTSPAIDQGNAGVLTLDQRGAPRTAGVQADIGSVERQPGEPDERIFVNGFDGLCDQ